MISYIISLTFCIAEFDMIKYPSRKVLIKGWSPAPIEAAVTNQQISRRSPQKSLSKNELKIRQPKALSNLDSEDNEKPIMKLL